MPVDIDANMGEVSDVNSENENEYDENGTNLKDDDDTMGDVKAEGADGEEVKKKYDPKDPTAATPETRRKASRACTQSMDLWGCGGGGSPLSGLKIGVPQVVPGCGIRFETLLTSCAAGILPRRA